MKMMRVLAASRFLAVVSVAAITTTIAWTRFALADCTQRCIGITCEVSKDDQGLFGCVHYSQTQAVITLSQTGSATDVLQQSGSSTIVKQDAASCDQDCEPFVIVHTGTASNSAMPYENAVNVNLQACVAATTPTGP